MKRLGITQRVENVPRYSERRDCLDQRWISFIWLLGFIPVPLPNVLSCDISLLLNDLQIDALILSGGNTIAAVDSVAINVAPDRDFFEQGLLKEAFLRNLPVVGVCRGMQILNLYMGGSLTLVSKHVSVRHSLRIIDNNYKLPETVNSYHKWGISREGLAEKFKSIGEDKDSNVEAFVCEEKKILGIMWHPEREQVFREIDINLIRRFLL